MRLADEAGGEFGRFAARECRKVKAGHKIRLGLASGGCGWVRRNRRRRDPRPLHEWGAAWHRDTPQTRNPKP